MTLAQTLVCAFALVLPLAASGDKAGVLLEFQKIRPDLAEVHVIAENPLLVAVTGTQGPEKTPATWARGELLGVFAHRGDGLVPITIQPNEEFPTSVWVENENADSITFGLADPSYGVLSDNLKIFFDPKTYFPKRIMQFAPVRVREIRVNAGVVSLSGSDGKQDFSAREQNGVWTITPTAAASTTMPPPSRNLAPVPSMPVSTVAEFEKERPVKAKQIPPESPLQIDEKVGPYQRVGNKIWVGKTFDDAGGSAGVGDIGYFDELTQNWSFLHIPEMADWSTSALLVEPGIIYAGLVRNSEGKLRPGGLLSYNRATHRGTIIPVADVIDKIVAVNRRIYCGTSLGFAVIEQGHAQAYEFVPRLDGSYEVTAAMSVP